MAKIGRKQKPYESKLYGMIPGLARDTNGRWRVVATGYRWTEASEERAIARFHELAKAQPVMLPIVTADLSTAAGQDQYVSRLQHIAKLNSQMRVHIGDGDGTVRVEQAVSDDAYWQQVTIDLLNNAVYAAKRTGIAALANLASMDLPRPSIKLSDIRDYYRDQNTSKDKSAAFRVFDGLIKHTHAKTLADLSKDALHNYRQAIETNPDIKSGGTKVWMYGKVKAVIAFALKSHDLDSAQVSAALDRCKVLWTTDEIPEYQPTPIRRDHLHALLKTAGDGPWRAWILMGLNCAMYLQELSELEWKHIDLAAGTLSMRRVKTKFPRAATLWPETIEALKLLRQAPTYVFTSPQGTRFKSTQSRCNEFAKLRDKTEGVPESVSFAALKDGAFTHTARGTAGDGRIAKILAGHSSGLEDAYNLRDPSIVRPACDAVYAHYGPFPLPA